jgi:hypothetical protein
MIEFTTTATVKAVTIKSKVKDGVTTRKLRFTLEKDFDDDIAAAFGPDAVKARKLLASGAMARCELPPDAVTASARLKNVESIAINLPAIAGVKAVGKSPDSLDGETPPSVQLTWECFMTREAAIWFCENVGGRCEFQVTPQQLSLLKDTPGSRLDAASAAFDRLKAAIPAGMKASVIADGRAMTIVDKRSEAEAAADDDRAAAASPEEAEAARAERIAREKADQRAAEGERFAPEIIAAADEAEARFTFMEAECESGPYVVAQFESPTHKMEADGDDRNDARLTLRLKVLEVLTADAAAGAPKVGLQVPAGAKAKTHKSTRAKP